MSYMEEACKGAARTKKGNIALVTVVHKRSEDSTIVSHGTMEANNDGTLGPL